MGLLNSWRRVGSSSSTATGKAIILGGRPRLRRVGCRGRNVRSLRRSSPDSRIGACIYVSEDAIDLYDGDGDCHVSASEIRAGRDSLLLFAPDLDLLDAQGNYAPNQDGVVDSISLGLRFTAVRATFDTP